MASSYGSGVFVVLVGIDGSGKSSLLSSMKTESVTTASWQDLRNHEIPEVMAPGAPSEIKSRLSDLPRAMFIGGHIVAQYEYLVRPELERGGVVLLDSYWYKVLAKEQILGRMHPSLAELCRMLPKPDVVVLLDVEPRTAFERKDGRIAAYEYFTQPDQEDFVRFQKQLSRELDEELTGHASVHRIDANRDFGTVLDETRTVVRCYAEQRLPRGGSR